MPESVAGVGQLGRRGFGCPEGFPNLFVKPLVGSFYAILNCGEHPPWKKVSVTPDFNVGTAAVAQVIAEPRRVNRLIGVGIVSVPPEDMVSGPADKDML